MKRSQPKKKPETKSARALRQSLEGRARNKRRRITVTCPKTGEQVVQTVDIQRLPTPGERHGKEWLAQRTIEHETQLAQKSSLERKAGRQAGD